jgi:predicted phosphodiesterase
MKYAIVSDIHANWQAWEAVKRDMRVAGVDGVLCLGDVIGYGPQPVRVLEDVYASCENFVLGNHDAVIGNRLDSSLFNDRAQHVIEWTREQLGDSAAAFFAEVPTTMGAPDVLCTHAEAAMPERWDYILKPLDAKPSFDATEEGIIFCGHTHVPLVVTLNVEHDSVTGVAPQDFTRADGMRYLVNVGSVGDPRDTRPEASYCIYDADTQQVKFRRVPFDYEAFRRDLLASELPVKPHFLGLIDSGAAASAEPLADMQVSRDEFKKKPIQSSDTVRIVIDETMLAQLDRRPDKKRRLKATPGKLAGQPKAVSQKSWLPAIVISVALLILCGALAIRSQRQAEVAAAPPDPAPVEVVVEQLKPAVETPIPVEVPERITATGVVPVEPSPVVIEPKPVVPDPVEPEVGLNLEPIASAILEVKLSTAQELLKDAAQDADGDDLETLKSIARMLQTIKDIDKLIMKDFAGKRGQSIDVELRSGREQLLVTRVTATTVEGEKRTQLGKLRKTFKVSDMTIREKLKRAQLVAGEETVALYRCLYAMSRERPDVAEQQFDNLGALGAAMRDVRRKNRADD